MVFASAAIVRYIVAVEEVRDALREAVDSALATELPSRRKIAPIRKQGRGGKKNQALDVLCSGGLIRQENHQWKQDPEKLKRRRKLEELRAQRKVDRRKQKGDARKASVTCDCHLAAEKVPCTL
jgi:hypothetical protein